MNPQKYVINIRPGVGIPPTVNVSQGDIERPLLFTIMDGLTPLAIDSEHTTVTITGTKPSGLGYTITGDIDGSDVTFYTTEQMTQEPGFIRSELIVTGTGSTFKLGSANFDLVVEPTTHGTGVIDGTTEDARTVLARCEEYASDAAASAAEAASEAGAAATAGATAGTAAAEAVVDDIEAEISDLKSDLKSVSNSHKNIVALEVTTPTYSLLQNKTLAYNGVINTSSGTTYQVTDYIPVVAGQIVACKYSRSRWGNRNWAFYDASYNLVEIYNKTASATTVEYNSRIPVPTGASYIVISYDMGGASANEPTPDVRIITKYTENVEPSPKTALVDCPSEYVTETAYTATNQSGKVISPGGLVINTTDTNFIVSSVDVAFGDVVNIYNCKTLYSNNSYAFYDASDLPIQIQPKIDNDAHDFMLISVPFGAVKLYVAGHTTNPTICKTTTIKTTKPLEWLGKKWVCVGDSLTDSRYTTRTTKFYFDYITDQTGISTYNMGASGTGYKKDYNGEQAFYQRILNMPTGYDVVTIFGSVNDMSQTLGEPSDTGTSTVCGCINATLDNLYSIDPTIPVGIVSPTPTDDYYPLSSDQKMTQYVSALKTICENRSIPFLDLYHASDLRPWDSSYRTLVYSNDDGNGSHPNEIGHKILSAKFKAFLESLIL